MRFHTTHLLAMVLIAAFVFAVIRQPEAWWAIIIPLIGGVFVVLPVLGTAELLTGRDSPVPQLGWSGGCVVCLVGAIGSVLAITVLSLLLQLGL